MKTTAALALAAVTVLTACIPSVSPFYSEGDLLFESRLLGEWHQKDGSGGSETWTFERGEAKAYKLTVNEKNGKQGTFHARLFKLNDERFLDIIPADCKFDKEQADLIGFALFPGHLLIRVVELGPELKLSFFDFDWLSKHLKEHPETLRHHREDDRILLTAATPDLQAFVLRHAPDGDLFGEPNAYMRAPGLTP